MSDTIMFGRLVKGSTKSIWLYTFGSLFMTVGGTIGADMLQMKHADWEQFWIMQKIGWWLVKGAACLGAAALTMKAGTSASTNRNESSPSP